MTIQNDNSPGNRSKKNLIIIASPHIGRWHTFESIAGHVRETAPDVYPALIHPGRANILKRLSLMRRPSMIFSCSRLPRRCLGFRGRLFQGGAIPKSEELRRLEDNGLPVPRWACLTRERKPDLSGFGPYVVMKPEYGCQGADVRIKKTGRVRWTTPKTRQAAKQKNSWLIQDFIYTVKWPVSYRVTTLFGEVLWSWCVTADQKRRPLNRRYGFCDGGDQGGGLSIVSSGRGCRFRLNSDSEILSLGQQVHGAFPELPVLGIDIIREQPSGKLFVLEVNSPGRTLHFSSKSGLSIQKYAGFDLDAQFDGLRKAGRILAEQTRLNAR